MNLQYYPMDSQLCYLELESCKLKFVFQRYNYTRIMLLNKDVRYKCTFNATLIPSLAVSYTMDDIIYKWEKGLNSVQLAADVSLPEWKALGLRQKRIEASLPTGNFFSIILYRTLIRLFTSISYSYSSTKITFFITGRYSRLALEIQFVRSTGYCLFRMYIPAIFLVATSFLSFLVNKKARSMRLALPVVSLFALILLATYINHDSAKISYVKASDIHILCCIVLVLLAILGKLKIKKLFF